MKTLAIDTGYANLGFARFKGDKLVGAITKRYTGKRCQGDTIIERLSKVSGDVADEIVYFWPDRVLIEWTENWTRDGKNVEELQKHALATGTIITITRVMLLWEEKQMDGESDMGKGRIEIIKQGDWKRKRKSKNIRFEMEALWKRKFSSEHASDAAAMGYWWLSRERIKDKIIKKIRSSID